MKRLQVSALCFCASLCSIILTGCSYDGPQYPTIYGTTPTPVSTPIPAFVNIAGSAYNPGAVTIVSGGSVIWTNNDAFAHTVWPDNGSGTCATDIPIAAGTSVTLTYPSPITIYYHCSIHAPSCNGTCLSTCTGMAGSVVVQ